jgi:hypothetical protein
MHIRSQATLDALEEGSLLYKRMQIVKTMLTSCNFNKGNVTDLCRCLYASLDDECSLTVAEECEKLARVDRARGAMGRLAHAWRPEIVDRPVEPPPLARFGKQIGTFIFLFI